MSIALFSLLGIVAGASLQYLFSRFLEERKHNRILQTEAYADYLRGVAEAAHLSPTVDENEVHARIANAKARICLYGSRQVVILLAEFERRGAAIISEEQSKAFVNVVQAMRGDAQAKSGDLELILLGSRQHR